MLKSPFLVTGIKPGKCFSGIIRPAELSGLNSPGLSFSRIKLTVGLAPPKFGVTELRVKRL